MDQRGLAFRSLSATDLLGVPGVAVFKKVAGNVIEFPGAKEALLSSLPLNDLKRSSNGEVFKRRLKAALWDADGEDTLMAVLGVTPLIDDLEDRAKLQGMTLFGLSPEEINLFAKMQALSHYYLCVTEFQTSEGRVVVPKFGPSADAPLWDLDTPVPRPFLVNPVVSERLIEWSLARGRSVMPERVAQPDALREGVADARRLGVENWFIRLQSPRAIEFTKTILALPADDSFWADAFHLSTLIKIVGEALNPAAFGVGETDDEDEDESDLDPREVLQDVLGSISRLAELVPQVPVLSDVKDWSWVLSIKEGDLSTFETDDLIEIQFDVDRLAAAIGDSASDFEILRKGFSRQSAAANERVFETFVPKLQQCISSLEEVLRPVGEHTGLPAAAGEPGSPDNEPNNKATVVAGNPSVPAVAVGADGHSESRVAVSSTMAVPPAITNEPETPVAAAEVKLDVVAATVSTSSNGGESAPIQDSEPDPDLAFWRFIDSGIPQAAYWMARAREASRTASPVHSGVLGVLVASPWASSWTAETLENARFLASQDLGAEGYEATLIRVAAGLVPSLVQAKTSVTNHWLQGVHTGMPETDLLLDEVRQFCNRAGGHSLTAADISDDLSRKDPKAAFTLLAAKANVILKSPWRLSYKRGEKTLAEILAKEVKPHLERMKTGVVPGTDDLELASAMFRKWHFTERPSDQMEQVDKLIQKYNTEVNGRNAALIISWAREKLREYTSSWLGLIWDWKDAAERAKHPVKEADWASKVSVLRGAINQLLPKVRREIDAQRSAHEVSLPRRAALRAFELSLDNLNAVINPEPWLSSNDRLAITKTIEGFVSAWLFNFPDCDLDRSGAPANLAALEKSLSVATFNKPAKALADAWLAKGVFGPVQLAKEMGWLQDDMDFDLRQARDQHQVKARRALEEMGTRIEQHYLNRQIDLVVRSSLVSRLGDLKEQAEQPEQSDFNSIHGELALLSQDLASLSGVVDPERWEEVKSAAQARGNLSKVVLETIRRGDAALVQRSTVELNEFIARLQEWLDGSIDESELLIETAVQCVAIEAFVKQQELLKVLASNGSFEALTKGLEAGKWPTVDGQPQQPFNLEEAATIRRLVEAFHACWLSPAGGREAVPAFLEALGFDVQSGQNAKMDKVRSKRWVTEYELIGVANRYCPIPYFGSELQVYRVVLINNPSLETAVRDALMGPNTPAIFVFNRPVDMHTRRKLWKLAKERRALTLMVDPLVVGFVALAESNVRERTLFELCLPGITVNPYDNMPKVAREMFKGRRVELEELLSDRGPVIVYGGRKLGKTAVLNRLADDFGHMSEAHTAVYVDFNKVGEQAGDNRGVNTGRDEIAKALRATKFFRGNRNLGVYDNLVYDAIKAELLSPGREGSRLLLLLDEADNFLNADEISGFENFKRLWDLRIETNFRFKFVLAGLHDVQRFYDKQRFDGSKFHNMYFGESVRIGVLNPTSIQRLILEPLNALGFSLEEEVVTRLVAESNSHTGLVQVMCRELLDLVKDASIGANPPYKVTSGQFIKLLQLPKVAERVRDMFNTSLKLDLRYRAIALSIAWYFRAAGGSRGNVYSVAEMRSLLAQICGEPFEDVGDSELRGLLDEMVGLGILVRSRDSFRLRTPNLVTMFGSEADIVNELDNLRQMPKSGSFDTMSHHSFLNPSDALLPDYSPLTNNQHTRALETTSGVTILVGSEMTRVGEIARIANRMADASVSGDEIARIRFVHEPTAAGFVEKVRAIADEVQPALMKSRSIMALCELTEVEQLGQIQEAQKFYAARRMGTKRWIRFVFVISPSIYWALESDQVFRSALQKEGVLVEFMRPFDRGGLQQVVEKTLGFADRGAVESLEAATGGWPAALARVRRDLLELKKTEISTAELASAIAGVARSYWQSIGAWPAAQAAFGVAGAPELCRLVEGIKVVGKLAVSDVEALEEFGVAGLKGLKPATVKAALDMLVSMGMATVEVKTGLYGLVPVLEHLVSA